MNVTPDELIPKALLDQIVGEITAEEYEELADTSFHVTIQLADKSTREKSKGLIAVTQAHRIIAHEALWLLNKDVRNGGTWIFVWYAPVPISRQPVDVIILWKDQDGDLICSAEIKNPIGRVYAGERVDFGGIAAAALDRTLNFWRDMEVTAAETRKAAQGQPSANPNIVPPHSPVA